MSGRRALVTVGARWGYGTPSLDPVNPIFNTAECIEIQGPVDPILFERALRQVVGEAEALHVRFGEDMDGPWQSIDPSPDWRFMWWMSAERRIRFMPPKAGWCMTLIKPWI